MHSPLSSFAMSLSQTFIKADPSLLVDLPGPPAFVCDSEAEYEPDEDSKTIGPAPAVKETSSKREVMDTEALQDLDESADDQYSDIPRWVAELRYIAEG